MNLQWSVDSPYKKTVILIMFPYHDVIMLCHFQWFWINVIFIWLNFTWKIYNCICEYYSYLKYILLSHAGCINKGNYYLHLNDLILFIDIHVCIYIYMYVYIYIYIYDLQLIRCHKLTCNDSGNICVSIQENAVEVIICSVETKLVQQKFMKSADPKHPRPLLSKQ